MNTPFNQIRHLKPGQVAQRLCVTEGTLERWRVEGTGPWYLRLPGRVLYRQADIEAFERRVLCLRTRHSEEKETTGGAS